VNGHKAEAKAENCAGCSRSGGPEIQHPSNYHHSRADQGRDCVKLSTQHGGNFPHEHIAHHAAADSCQHAEERRRNRGPFKRDVISFHVAKTSAGASYRRDVACCVVVDGAGSLPVSKQYQQPPRIIEMSRIHEFAYLQVSEFSQDKRATLRAVAHAPDAVMNDLASTSFSKQFLKYCGKGPTIK
jgi:hypothetical protein